MTDWTQPEPATHSVPDLDLGALERAARTFLVQRTHYNSVCGELADGVLALIAELRAAQHEAADLRATLAEGR